MQRVYLQKQRKLHTRNSIRENLQNEGIGIKIIMISLIGFSSLLAATFLNFFLIFSKFIVNLNLKKFNLIIRSSSIFTFCFLFSLMYAYITSDFFSNFNVFQNSHSDKPIIYKISGTWGNHEGSMLLWLSILSIYAFFFSYTKNIDENLKKK